LFLCYADGFDNTVAVDDKVTLQWNIVSIEGALYMQAKQTLKALGWTGWALSAGELPFLVEYLL
jgi:hypothetical protein